MLRWIFIISLLSLIVACGHDDKAAPVPPPDITVFKNWVKETPSSVATINGLADLTINAENTGAVPSFFVNTPLMRREDRDNVQNGYLYPLYFQTKTHQYPARQWNDGYTVREGDPSDSGEAQRIQDIDNELAEFWGEDSYTKIFGNVNNFGLIDIRYYSLKPAPPLVAETCFTVRWTTGKSGTTNFCFNGHRYLKNSAGIYPTVRWDYNVPVASDSIEAFKMFVVALASFEVIFDNPDNRKLRDIFSTNERLSVQMFKANKAFDGIFDSFVQNQAYLDGRQ